MPAKLLDGKALAQTIQDRVATETAELRRTAGFQPGLGVLLIGDDPASASYVRNKERCALAAGFHSEVRRLPPTVLREEALGQLEAMARDRRLHGILVQLPLPRAFAAEQFQLAVPPAKDVDGLHPWNAGQLLLGREGLRPCTPLGVMELLRLAGRPLAGANAVVVGRSNIVGKPLALMLLQAGCTVTIAHSKTRNLATVCRSAEIIVAAVGVPGLIGRDEIAPGAIVIDVGINEVTDRDLAQRLLAGQPERWTRFEKTGRTLVGDVDFAAASEQAAALTPVPGGVGPLTVAFLLENTLRAARRAAECAR